MKRQRKQQRTSGKKRGAQATKPSAAEIKDIQKRNTLKLLQYGAIGTLIFGGIGGYAYHAVTTSQAEHDLSQIGQGTPTIVQIHDPNCPICMALQKEVRQALGTMEGGTIDYRVANIRTLEGSRFAARYGVPHVTLLLFDGSGTLQQTLNGPRQSEELEVIFNVLANP